MKLTKEDLVKLESIKDYLLSYLIDRLADFSLEIGQDCEKKYFSPEDLILVLYSDEYELLTRLKNK